MHKFFLILTAVLTLSGCIRVGPKFCCPKVTIPEEWAQGNSPNMDEESLEIAGWWRLLDDPLLSSLIEEANFTNLTLKEALARIQEARALRGIARGEWFPAIDGDALFQRIRRSEDFIGAGVNPIINRQDWTFVDVSWELDVWGRILSRVESETANLFATIEDWRALQVILFSDIASVYTELRTLQERLRVARYNVEGQQRSFVVSRARFDAQLTSELDVFQAELNLARTKSVIPFLEAEIFRTKHRLAVLLGLPPEALYETLEESAPIPVPPAEIHIGIPCDLLRQRPDIRRAEWNYASKFSLIGAAVADLYPSFSLSGLFGLSASADLLDASNRVWNLGAGYSWKLFRGGALRRNVDRQVAIARQARLRYEQSVLIGLEEVESALIRYEKEIERNLLLRESVEAAEKSVELVRYQYKTGLVRFDVVLDLETRLFDEQDRLAQSNGLITLDLIQIYKALGGGWQCVDMYSE